jgi:hypothetical protein
MLLNQLVVARGEIRWDPFERLELLLKFMEDFQVSGLKSWAATASLSSLCTERRLVSASVARIVWLQLSFTPFVVVSFLALRGGTDDGKLLLYLARLKFSACVGWGRQLVLAISFSLDPVSA